jgi:aerobic-type carbon monoxide dehydrogenase small subunit (CoxS/CutS family)
LKYTLHLRLNGEDLALSVRPQDTLLDVLRREVHLYGTRETCGIGICGTCTVLVDGKPMSACLLLAPQVDGAQVLTVEGLSAHGRLHPLQEAFINNAAFQCSYCTPGMLLSALALLNEMPQPQVEQIKAYMSGNLCRCGSYLKIIQAIQEAANIGQSEMHQKGGEARSTS